MEIEKLELSNATTREGVKGKDASTTALVVARSTAVTALEQQAVHLENQFSETNIQCHRILNEMKSTFTFIEVLFTSLGCDSSLAPRKPQLAMMSPLSKQTASLNMYASPALAEVVKEGSVSASSLPHFMGMVENRGADIIQTYAAMVSSGLLQDGENAGENVDIASRKAEMDEIKMLQAVEAAATGALGDDALGEPTALVNSDTSRGGRFISSSALGPSRPTGKLKESLTTSALVAAMAVTVSAGGPVAAAAAAGATAGASGKGKTGRPEPMQSSRHAVEEEPEDESSGPPRPFTMGELKQQATYQINNDESIKAITNAATAAALILGRHGSS